MSDIDLSPIATFINEANRYRRVIEEIDDIIIRLTEFRTTVERRGKATVDLADRHAKLAGALFKGVTDLSVSVNGVYVHIPQDQAEDLTRKKIDYYLDHLRKNMEVVDGYAALIEIFRHAYQQTIEVRFPKQDSGQTA